MTMLDGLDRRRLVNVLAVLALVALVLPFVVVGVPQVVGADHSYVVLSGSMQPSMGPGDVVVVRSVPPDSIAVGDTITFQVGDETTTHRVVAVERTADGPLFTTKGTANDAVDPRPIPGSAVVGEVWFVVPWAGHVVLFANTKLGAVALLGVPGALLILSELYELYRARDRASDSTTDVSNQ